MQNLTNISRSKTTSITPVWYKKMYLIKRMCYIMIDMTEILSAEKNMEEYDNHKSDQHVWG